MQARSKGSVYAVAVRDREDLWLICRIRRSTTGIYFLIPRDDPDWDPHASYHQDGQRHVKDRGGKYIAAQRQRLDESFRGAESLFAMALPPGQTDRLKTPCKPEEFSAVFEIDREFFLPEEDHALVVDLVEPGQDVLTGPWREVVMQRLITDGTPWIVVTLWRGFSF